MYLQVLWAFSDKAHFLFFNHFTFLFYVTRKKKTESDPMFNFLFFLWSQFILELTVTSALFTFPLSFKRSWATLLPLFCLTDFVTFETFTKPLNWSTLHEEHGTLTLLALQWCSWDHLFKEE